MASLVSSSASIVESPFFVVAFLWLSAALGRRLFRFLGVSRGGSLLERAVVATGLGAGALQFVPIALGATGMLGVRSLRLAMGAIAILLVPDLLATANAARRLVARPSGNAAWSVAWVVALIPGLAAVLLLALTPILDPDGISYHLMVPKRWLHSGSLSYLPTYPPSNSPLGFEMLFTIALVFAGDVAAKLLHFSFGVLGAVGLRLAGTRLKAPFAGALAGTLFLLGPTGMGLFLGAAYVEGATAFAVIASSLAWLVWYRERGHGWLRLAATLAGIGVSFKLTAALFPLALGALTIIVLWDEGRRLPSRLGDVALPVMRLVVLVLVPVGPWFIRSAIVTGNPLFPLFARWIPSRDMSPTLSTQYENFNRYLNWANIIGADWTLGRRRLILLMVGLSLTLLTVVVFKRMPTRLARGSVLVLLVTALLQLFTAGLYMRYWVPVLSVLLLPILATFERLFSSRAGRRGIVATTAILSILTARKAVQSVEGDLKGLVATAVGVEGRREFLMQHLRLLPLYERVNDTLPAGTRVLLAGVCHGFYVERTTFCIEFPTEALRVSSLGDFTADLRALGVTHIVAPMALATGGSVPPTLALLHREREQILSQLLSSHHVRLLTSASDQGLYALDTASFTQ